MVTGALLPHPRLPAISELFAVPGHLGSENDSRRVAGVLGIDLPGIGRRFPGDPRSSTARFRLAVNADCEIADIFVRMGEETFRLGRITVHRRDT